MRILLVTILSIIPLTLVVADSPGVMIGTTYYELQANTSGVNRIAEDSDGGLHVCWCNGFAFPVPRRIYYNYRYPNGVWATNSGWQISPDIHPQYGTDYDAASFPGISIGPNGCIAVFYHSWIWLGDTTIYEINITTNCPNGTDNFIILPPDYAFWPRGEITNQGLFHVIAGRFIMDIYEVPMIYNFSQDWGFSWFDWMTVDSLYSRMYAIATSRITNRTAIVRGIPIDPSQESYYDNNVGYYISEYGGIFRFDQLQMITHYENQNIRAGADVDLLFDENDYLHVVWNTYHLPSPDSNYGNSSALWHWSEETNQISQIAYFPHVSCNLSDWDLALAKMSLGVDEFNNLFCIWTGYDSTDKSDDNYCNGDIYMAFSSDNGLTWSDHENLTNSHTPNCATGNCDSDSWATIAEKVTDYLNITYVEDKDAGIAVFWQGDSTLNFIRYLEVPKPIISGLENETMIPDKFISLSCHPNPFNAQAAIEFTMTTPGNVDLTIYDITGAEVETFKRSGLEAGRHSIIWDAKDAASGVYFAKMRAGSKSKSVKMVLIK